MTIEAPHPEKFRVLVVGGGVASLETVLALRELAAERVSISVLAPDEEFVYRPMTVREPFAYSRAARYPLAPIMSELGAELVADKLGWVEPESQRVHTEGGRELGYDALVLALGARACARYDHAVTVDDRRMDETLHGLIQDIEGGYLDSVAFVAPGRMAWPLPLYELALMTAGRAYDMNVDLDATVITAEDSPLAIFGSDVSAGVAARLAKARIETINSAYVEIPSEGEIVINPGDRRLRAQRVIALPELYGPSVRGLPVSEHGFISVNRFGRVPDSGPIYAAGDAVDFPIKQGGLASQMADVVAESIAALVGVPIEPRPFNPVIRGVLLTDGDPLYISAQITGGQGFSSQISDAPTGEQPHKIAAKYLAPYLDRLDRERVVA
jgi:sulfide:quinone oxidoreductase